MESVGDVPGKDDDPVSIPGSSAPRGDVGNRLGTSPGGFHFLQLARNEEPDEATVGRPEWKRSFLCSLEGLGFKRAQRTQPQKRRAAGRRDEGEVTTIG